MELWKHRDKWLTGWPMALVAQNGIEDLEIPWHEMDALFIGGVDPWKDSKAVADLVKTAKTLGIWVHVGRLNSPKRFDHFDALGADSCDGSGIARYDHMLEAIVRRNDPERSLFDSSEKQNRGDL